MYYPGVLLIRWFHKSTPTPEYLKAGNEVKVKRTASSRFVGQQIVLPFLMGGHLRIGGHCVLKIESFIDTANASGTRLRFVFETKIIEESGLA